MPFWLNTTSNVLTICSSVSLVGATYSTLKELMSTSGKALRSTLPLTVKGIWSKQITNDGFVYAWGYNYYGELGIGNTSNMTYPTKVKRVSQIMQISADCIHFAMT